VRTRFKEHCAALVATRARGPLPHTAAAPERRGRDGPHGAGERLHTAHTGGASAADDTPP